MRYMPALIALCLISGIVYAPSQAAAQSSLDLIFGTDLAMDLSPENPGAGERVYATVRSSVLDLSAVTLTWKKNGQEIKSGVGLTEIEVAAGALGSETRLVVEVSEDGIPFATAEAFIRPTSLELLWEADSYVPPFYHGRALPSAGTNLRFEAMPRFIRDGSTLSTRDLIFTWKRNGYVIQSASGRGKSTAVLESPSLFGKETIAVEAKTSDGVLANEESIRIESQSPRIVLYQMHPVFGTTYHSAFSDQTLIRETEATFSAIPYFAETDSPNDPTLRYGWKINGVEIENDEKSPSIITINAGNSSGEALLELFLTHATNLFLNTGNSWGLLFDNTSTAAPFGTPQ